MQRVKQIQNQRAPHHVLFLRVQSARCAPELKGIFNELIAPTARTTQETAKGTLLVAPSMCTSWPEALANRPDAARSPNANPRMEVGYASVLTQSRAFQATTETAFNRQNKNTKASPLLVAYMQPATTELSRSEVNMSGLRPNRSIPQKLNRFPGREANAL
jgi:hypothetical protein